MSEERRRLQGYLLAAFSAVCWATGGLLAKWLFAYAGFPVTSFQLAAARPIVAVALLLIYLVVARPKELRVGPRDLWFLAIFGIAGLAMMHYTYFTAISLTNVATAILLEYLAPVIVLVFSVAFLGERLTWTLPLGVGLSIAGCALVVGVFSGAGLAVSPAGIAWGLASAFFFALYSVMGRAAAGRFSPWTLLAYGLLFASAFWLLPLRAAPAVYALLSRPVGLLVVVVIALVSTLLPFGAFLVALTRLDATRATVTAALEPVIAGVGAAVFFHESFSSAQLVGAGLVVAAIFVVQSRASFGAALPPGD